MPQAKLQAKQVAPPLSKEKQEELAEKYIAFRTDPLNDRFEDAKFCSENGISLSTLENLKSIEISHKVDSVSLTEQHIRNSAETLARKINQLLMQKKLPIKSLEGLTNAYTNLLKQLALLRGAPTERIEFEEVRKLSLEDTHRWLMRHLRSSN